MKQPDPQLDAYKKYVAGKLARLKPLFARAAIGDFSKNVPIGELEDEFTELYVGVQIILEVVREQTKELKQLNRQLQQNLEDRTAALEAEVEETAKRDAIMESIGEGLIVTNQKAEAILINRTALEMLGLSAEEVLYQKWSKAVRVLDSHQKPLALKKRPVAVVLRTGNRVVTNRYFYQRKDGSLFPVSINVAPVKRRDKIIGTVLVFRDITHQREVERSKDEFVALASHQLRTPVSIIRWYSQLLLQNPTGLTNKQVEYLQEISTGSKRMGKLIRALLSVAQIETGTFSIHLQPVNVVAVARAALKDLTADIKAKQLQLERDFEARLPKLQGDPSLIQIVLHNLLSNAVKYTPTNGQIKLSIGSASAGTKAGDRRIDRDSIMIEIADTGYGIPYEQQPQIFTKLFRANNIRSKVVEGTGLGLYIARTIVEQSGGAIWFESYVERGTTFYVTLPLGKAKK